MPWKITPSLYNTWLFYRYPLFDRTEEQEQDARKEMINALCRIKTPDTPEQARGHLFETYVENIATLRRTEDLEPLDPNELACARTIATNCKDGVFQERGGRELPSGNYIYGVADCILPTTIVDFKRVGAGKYEQGKYQKSIQHLAYMYIWESKRFDYLICDGESAEPFDEFYTWNSGSLGLLESRIALMIHDINCDPEFAAMFAENWTYQPKGEENVGENQRMVMVEQCGNNVGDHYRCDTDWGCNCAE